jgi:hypothetical protein
VHARGGQRNLAFEALKKELEILEAKKTRPAEEVEVSALPAVTWRSY